MKFESVRFKEKTIECFGKKRISGHGAAAVYRSKDGEGSLETKEELSTLLLHHVISNDTKQDCVAVCCIIEAILASLQIELPYVKTFSLLSCFQNDLVLVMAPVTGNHHSLTIQSFIYSETQGGKSLVDAHFALAMMHVRIYCNATKRDVTTPADICEAINSLGGRKLHF